MNRETIASVLADFHGWLTTQAVLPAPPPGPPPPPAPDLHTLLGQLTALRHEVNLQTRATRTALDELRTAREPAAPAEAVPDAQRPLLTSLVDLYDSLAQAGREITRVRDAVLPTLSEAVVPTNDNELSLPPCPAPSWWQRLLGGEDGFATWHASVEKQLSTRRDRSMERAHVAEESVVKTRRALDALVTGYTMSLQRLERSLTQHGLVPIVAKGESFDPEQMEVLEAVDDSGALSGTVLDEVRRGYLLDGRVFRCALVRVAR